MSRNRPGLHPGHINSYQSASPGIASRWLPVLVTVLGMAAMPVFGQQISAECEAQLALSALPERLRASATVYVYGDEGFTAQPGQGDTFSCILERNHPLSLIPQCLDRAGTEAILPALMHKTERVLSGNAPNEVRDAFAVSLQQGEYAAPARPGVSYMVSAYNRIYLSARDEIINVGPHVMFYAPGLSNDDIGGSHAAGMSNHGMPFVLDEGPHGYMITYVDQASDTAAVRAACKGQLQPFGFDL